MGNTLDQALEQYADWARQSPKAADAPVQLTTSAVAASNDANMRALERLMGGVG